MKQLPTFTRRQLVQGTLIGAGGAILYGTGLDISQLPQSVSDNREAKLSVKDFIDLNFSWLKAIKLGATFMPDQLPKEMSEKQKLIHLKWLIDTLGLKNFRLGIQWDRVEQLDGTLDTEYYLPYIRTVLDSGVELILNVGPIKTCRYPEVYIPSNYYQQFNLQQFEGTLPLNHPLGEIAVEYIDKLLTQLVIQIPELKARIKTIQFDNEPFTKFGIPILPNPKWLEFYMDSADRILDNQAQVLMNSAALLQVPQIIEKLRSEPDAKRFIVGADYYTELVVNNIPVTIDPFLTSLSPGNSLSELKRQLIELGVTTAIPELQMEPWGVQKTPGNSIEHLQFVLQRSFQFALTDTPHSFPILLWGAEGLAQKAFTRKLNNQHIQMIELIQHISK